MENDPFSTQAVVSGDEPEYLRPALPGDMQAFCDLIEELKTIELGQELVESIEIRADTEGYTDVVSFILDDMLPSGYIGFLLYLQLEASLFGYDEVVLALGLKLSENFGWPLEEDVDAIDELYHLAALQPATTHQLKKVLIKDDASACPICLVDFSIGSEATALDCLHKYHEECLAEWLLRKNTCPMCRFEIPLAITPMNIF